MKKPATPDGRAMPRARHSIRCPARRITTDATVSPTAWIDSEKLRATAAGVSSTFVKIGNATAPPPTGDDPPRKPPEIIVTVDSQWSATRPSSSATRTVTSQVSATAAGTA